MDHAASDEAAVSPSVMIELVILNMTGISGTHLFAVLPCVICNVNQVPTRVPSTSSYFPKTFYSCKVLLQLSEYLNKLIETYSEGINHIQ